jgi:hypothetical protein
MLECPRNPNLRSSEDFHRRIWWGQIGIKKPVTGRVMRESARMAQTRRMREFNTKGCSGEKRRGFRPTVVACGGTRLLSAEGVYEESLG